MPLHSLRRRRSVLTRCGALLLGAATAIGPASAQASPAGAEVSFGASPGAAPGAGAAVLSGAPTQLAAGSAAQTRPVGLDTQPAGLDTKLADAFRVDLTDVTVTYDYWPETSRIEGAAVLEFVMRPGQIRPVFHFNPLRFEQEPEQSMLLSLELDGEILDPQKDDDLRRIQTSQSAEPVFEVQRDVDAATSHTLEISWAMPNEVSRQHPSWFYTNFDDTEGPDDETETLWPTISSPEELARHRISVNVHSDRRFDFVGSGRVDKLATADAEVQSWQLDTERAIASHTVMFAAVPAKGKHVEEFTTSGVHVKIVTTRTLETLDRARVRTEQTVAELIDDFGPFPMPRLQILLTGWHSGMEFYGATRTGLGSLHHELGHMYFGTSAVNTTWRDTWIDEAAVVWWERQDKVPPLAEGFHSDIANGRSVVAPGFDERAYGAGARVFGEIAGGLGSSNAMIDFLRDLYERRAYVPFTTDEFVDDAVAAQDVVSRADLERWLYTP